MRAAADRDAIGVASDKMNGFDWNAKPFGDELREARLVPLALRYDADHDFDDPFGQHGDFGFLARHAGGDVDVIADADAAIAAALSRLRAALFKAGPVAELQRRVHSADIVAIVVFDAKRIFVRHLLFGHEIAAADGDTVESAVARGKVDQPLHDENHFRA